MRFGGLTALSEVGLRGRPGAASPGWSVRTEPASPRCSPCCPACSSPNAGHVELHGRRRDARPARSRGHAGAWPGPSSSPSCSWASRCASTWCWPTACAVERRAAVARHARPRVPLFRHAGPARTSAVDEMLELCASPGWRKAPVGGAAPRDQPPRRGRAGPWPASRRAPPRRAPLGTRHQGVGEPARLPRRSSRAGASRCRSSWWSTTWRRCSRCPTRSSCSTSASGSPREPLRRSATTPRCAPAYLGDDEPPTEPTAERGPDAGEDHGVSDASCSRSYRPRRPLRVVPGALRRLPRGGSRAR